MAPRILVIVSILGLFNAYGAARIFARWPWMDAHPLAAWAWALGFFLLQLSGPFGDHLWLPKLRRGAPWLVVGLDWISYVAFGVTSITVAYVLALDIVTIPWRMIAPPADPAAFDRVSLLALVGAVAATTVAGLIQARAGARVKTVEVPLAKLPAAFDGFRIAQISDLHVGPTIGKGYTEEVVNAVNALRPDLIALTGDFADGAPSDFAAGIAPLMKLEAPDGKFFVTGNHEYFWDAGAWMAAMRTLGARVLVNEHVLIRRGHDALVLAGVTDYSTRNWGPPHGSNPAQALAGAPPGLLRVVLAHQPASYKACAEAGCDLQLSGHTHAGQYFPFNLLIGFFQRYYKGLNRHSRSEGSMWVYVNTGTGYWGPPLRAAVPAEISLLVLRQQH